MAMTSRRSSMPLEPSATPRPRRSRGGTGRTSAPPCGTYRERSGQVLGRAQEVLAEAGRDAAAEAGVVAARLTEISANDEASAQLAAGVLGSSGLGPAELFGELEPSSRPARHAATGRREKRSAAPKRKPAATATKAAKDQQQALNHATRARDDAAKDLTARRPRRQRRPPPRSATPTVSSNRYARRSPPPTRSRRRRPETVRRRGCGQRRRAGARPRHRAELP